MVDANDYFPLADTSSESEVSESSDDEQIINFIDRLGRPRKIPRLQIRKDHFNYWDDEEFRCRFRLSKETVVVLLDEISDNIKHLTNWNHTLTPMEMLLLILRFYSSGSFLIVIGDFSGVHESTVSRIVYKVTPAIANLRENYIKFPNTENEKNLVKQNFHNIARFLRVVGALDCTHIKIKSPGGENAEIYRNRKGFFSLNVQTVSDANLKILNIVARWPGSVHDSTIFNNSQLCASFENNDIIKNCILIGDSGYPLKNYLLTPLLQTNTIGENLYNEAHIRTRNPVERSYGVWKRRFPILSNGINLELNKVQWIIVATAVLHNIAIINNENDPPPLNEAEEGAYNLAINVPVDAVPHNNNFNLVRNELITHFENL